MDVNADLDVDVVIVGAGPTGITAATLLGRAGLRCIVLERFADVFPLPRAVHLDDEVYRILNSLGVGEKFAAISRPSLGLRLLSPTHDTLAEFVRPIIGPGGLPCANMFDQPELEALLRRNLATVPNATLRGGVEVIEVVPVGSECVRVDFAAVDNGETASLTAAYVLGCDGANSLVRRSIGSELRDLGFEQRWLVVDIDCDVELGHWEGVHQVCDPHRAATYMRVGDRRYRWEFRLLDAEAATDFGTLDDLAALLAPWIDAAQLASATLVRCAEYTFRAQVAKRWRAGRIFLLGDAAHLTPPFIGQGMGAGLRDAANLAWKIAGVHRGTLDDSVLDTYETERKPHATALVRLAKLTGVVMTGGGQRGAALRGVVAPQLHRIPMVSEQVTNSETPPLCRPRPMLRRRNYRGLVGRLAPNLEVGVRRYDDEAGTGFAIVSAVTPSPSQRKWAEARGVAIVATRPTEPLGRWLLDNGATVVVVRPDRTIAHAGSSLDSALAACDSMLKSRI